MDDLVECLPNRCTDARMVVPQRGAYLAGGEVEDPPSGCRLHERATRPDDELVEERSPVADQLSRPSIVHVLQCVSVSVDAAGWTSVSRPAFGWGTRLARVDQAHLHTATGRWGGRHAPHATRGPLLIERGSPPA